MRREAVGERTRSVRQAAGGCSKASTRGDGCLRRPNSERCSRGGSPAVYSNARRRPGRRTGSASSSRSSPFSGSRSSRPTSSLSRAASCGGGRGHDRSIHAICRRLMEYYNKVMEEELAELIERPNVLAEYNAFRNCMQDGVLKAGKGT